MEVKNRSRQNMYLDRRKEAFRMQKVCSWCRSLISPPSARYKLVLSSTTTLCCSESCMLPSASFTNVMKSMLC